MTSFVAPYELVLVDDDEDILDLMTNHIEVEFKGVFKIDSFSDPVKAFEHIKANETCIVVSDIHMPEMYGDMLLNKCRALEKGIMAIAMSGYPNFTKAVSSYRDGDIGFLIKPFDFNVLKTYLNLCIKRLELWHNIIEQTVKT